MNKKRNILLVVLPYLLPRKNLKTTKMRSFKAFPYGLLSIATYLKKNAANNVHIKIFDCNFSNGTNYLDLFRKEIEVYDPDIVGLSMMFDNSYKYVSHICSIIKEHNRDALIVMGGQAASSSYVYILQNQPHIDAVCFQDGEIPFFRLATSKIPSDILHTDSCWATKDSVRHDIIPQKMMLQNIDEVIDIDYSFVAIDDYSMEEAFSPFSKHHVENKQFFLVTSRGCPFKCVFCMHSSHNDRSMRYANVDKLIKHVEHLVTKHKMNVLTIYDDQLLFNKNRAKEIFSRLADFNIRIECPNGLSVAYIDEEMAMLMRRAGMDTVALAIESGSSYVLTRLINKPLRLDKVAPVIGYLRKYDFWIQGFFVIGIPGETDEHREETIKFIKSVGLDWSGFSCALPIPGTKLYKICVENGYIAKNIGLGQLNPNKYIINTSEYSPEYISTKAYRMNLDVNFVHNYRMKIGDYETAAKAFTDVIARYGNHAFAYYYLAESNKKLGNDKTAQKARDRFYMIVKRNSFWKDHAAYFGLE